MQYFLAQLANGLAMGSIYALLAVGYSIIYGILRLINFAHGDLCMFGTFIAFTILLSTGNVFLTILGACIAGALVGLVVERFAYRPVRKASRSAPFVSAIGAALILRNIAQRVWGSSTMHFPPLMPTEILEIGDFRISQLTIAIFFIAVVLMLAVALFVQRTKIGLAIRCVSQNIAISQLMGIRVNQVIAVVYAFGAAVGVFGEVLYATYYNNIFIGMGFQGTMKAFTAALLGGLGSLYGSFLGGIILGLAEAFGAGFVSSGYRDAIVYGVLIIVMLVKPSGIFGSVSLDKA